MSEVKIGDYLVSDGHPCFITFEAGATHSGLDSAKKLIDLAAISGANAVKFQICHDLDRLISNKKQMFNYSVLVDEKTGQTEEVSEPLYDILLRRFLTKDEWIELKKHADKLGLAFFATAIYTEDIDLIHELNCESIKIGSADVNHHSLIKYAANTGLCIQLDTGNSTIGEIEEAVDIVLESGNENIIIHQCPSGYPARLDSINLNIIPTLKKMFQLPIAYSDHYPGWEMDVAALALGANLLEKTITLDRTTKSVEHIFSLNPGEMTEFVKIIRDVEKGLGKPRRIMSEKERHNSLAARRSCFFAVDAKQGDIVTIDMIDFRRPGYGISPKHINKIIGKKLKTDCQAGDIIEWNQIN